MRGDLYCGTNQEVKSDDNTTPFESLGRKLKSLWVSPLKTQLAPVKIKYENGVERDAFPYIWNPRMDFSEGVGCYCWRFYFPDTQTVEPVRWRLFQLMDTNPAYRFAGIRDVSWVLDLSDVGLAFKNIGLRSDDIMPKGIAQYLMRREPRIMEHYITPMLWELERAKFSVRTLLRRTQPQEEVIHVLRNMNSTLRQLLDMPNIQAFMEIWERNEQRKHTSAKDYLDNVQQVEEF